MIHITAKSLGGAYRKTFFKLLEGRNYDDAEIYKEDVATIEINININSNSNFEIRDSKFIIKNNYTKSFPYVSNALVEKELLYWENSLLKKNNLNKIINFLKKDPLSKRAIILFWNDKFRNVNGKSVCEIASFFRKKGEHLDINLENIYTLLIHCIFIITN